jgi:hypothetical protein
MKPKKALVVTSSLEGWAGGHRMGRKGQEEEQKKER